MPSATAPEAASTVPFSSSTSKAPPSRSVSWAATICATAAAGWMISSCWRTAASRTTRSPRRIPHRRRAALDGGSVLRLSIVCRPAVDGLSRMSPATTSRLRRRPAAHLNAEVTTRSCTRPERSR